MTEKFDWSTWWEKEKQKKADSQLDKEEQNIIGTEEDASTEDFFYTPNIEQEHNKNYKVAYELQVKKAQRLHPDDFDKQKEYLNKWETNQKIQRQYAEQIVGGVYDAVDSALSFTVNRFLPEDYKLHMPEIAPPETMGQAFARGGAQFMIPYAGWYKALSTSYKLLKGGKKGADAFKAGWKADFGASIGAGAITDVVHFKPEDPTLSNLIQQYPHLRNPITNFLQTNPDDPAAINQFKRAIEGAGLGSLFTTIFKGVQVGFRYTRTKATEKIIDSAVKQTDQPWAPRRNTEGDIITGSYYSRVNGEEIFIDYNKATGKWDATVRGKVVASYKRLKEAKKSVDNLMNHRENLNEALSGKNKKDFDDKDPLGIVMADKVTPKTFTQRWRDFKEIMTTRLAMQLFDTYHGSKLLSRDVYKGKLTKKGLKELGKDPLGGYKEVRLNAATAGLMEHALKYGTFRWSKTGQFIKTGKSLHHILSPVDKDITSFMHFWAAKRLLNLQRFDKTTGKWVKDTEKIKRMWGSDKEVEQAFKNAESLGTKRAADGRTFDEILKDTDKFNNEILNFAKQSGIIDAEHLARLKKSPHFIPFYRDFADIDGNTGLLGKGGLGNVLYKKLTGAPIGKKGLKDGIKDTHKIDIVDHSKSYIDETGKKVIKTRSVTVDKYPLKDLVEGYLQNVFSIIKNSQRNRIMLNQISHIEELIRQHADTLMKGGMRKTLALKEAKKEIGKRWAQKVDRKITKHTVNLEDGNIKKQFEDSNVDLSNMDDLIFYSPERMLVGPREFVVSKIIKGKRKLEVWKVSDAQPYLFESFNSLSDKGIKFNNKLMWLSGKAKNLLTRGVTYDPGFFAWANFLRDTAAASILSKNAFIPITSSAIGFFKQISKNGIVKGKDGVALKNPDGSVMRYQDMWEEFVLNGGSFGSTLLRSELNESALKRLYKELKIPYKNVINKPQQILGTGGKAAGKIIRGYDDFVGKFEYASRFQEYSHLRQRGVNAREAAYQAREIATDFGMHGSSAVVRFLTQQVPFLNAGLQGLYRTGRAFEGLTAAEKRFVGAKIVTALTAPTVIFRYLNQNSEEYDNLAPHVKDMNWTIPLKGGNFMYIPKPFEWGAMSTVLDRFWDTVGPQPITIDGRDVWWGGEKDFTWNNFLEVFSKVLSEQLRLDVTPQIIDPWIDIMINKRFTGSPITPTFIRDNMPTEAAYYPWSNAAIVNVWQRYHLASMTTLSPIEFEHIVKTYTGAMGQFFLDFVIDPLGTEGELMFERPILEAEQGLPFGLDKVLGKSPGVFHDWNKVPLLKRMFSVSPNRHTRTLLDSYKLQREIKKRVNELNKYAPDKTTANSYQYKRLVEDPYTQDILALDRALASQFDRMKKLANWETRLWSESQKGVDRKEKGKELIRIREEKNKLSQEIIKTVKGMDLDYVIPTPMTLPITRTEWDMRDLLRKFFPKESQAQSSAPKSFKDILDEIQPR